MTIRLPQQQSPYICWFEEIGINDVPLVGGKNASLGEMYRELAPKGVKVPNGFAITAEAYRYFIREAGLDARIKDIVKDLNTHDLSNLRQRGRQVRHAILSASLPVDLEQAITAAYDQLSHVHPETDGRGCPEQRHGGRFAQCQLCRPTGNLFECPRAPCVARHL